MHGFGKSVSQYDLKSVLSENVSAARYTFYRAMP
jgi:hypothetical protein